MFLTPFAAAAVLGVTSVAAPAKTDVFVFEYSQNELHTSIGHQDMIDRLSREARRHCSQSSSRGFEYRRLEDECEAKIMTSVKTELGLGDMRLSRNER